MKKRIVFATLIVVMLAGLMSLIPNQAGTTYPAPTPIPTQSGPYPLGRHNANTEGLRISFANCAVGYIAWENMPDYYWNTWTPTSPRVRITTLQGEQHSYTAPFWYKLDTINGNIRFWKVNFPLADVNSKVWYVEGIFYVNQDTPGNERFWTGNTYIMKCNIPWRHVLFFPQVRWP